MDAEDRICERPGCDGAIERKEGETVQNFLRRRYCDRRCAALHGNEKLARRFNSASYRQRA
jgi:hypothetical protein